MSNQHYFCTSENNTINNWFLSSASMLNKSSCQIFQNNEFLSSHDVQCQYSSWWKSWEKFTVIWRWHIILTCTTSSQHSENMSEKNHSIFTYLNNQNLKLFLLSSQCDYSISKWRTEYFWAWILSEITLENTLMWQKSKNLYTVDKTDNQIKLH